MTGPIADEEAEPGGMVAEVHDEVAGLLRRPRPVGMRGQAQDVPVAVATSSANKISRHSVTTQSRWKKSTASMLAAWVRRKLAPADVGVPDRCRWDAGAPEDPADRRGADAVAELEQLALHPAIPQLGFSVAMRTTSAAIASLTGGRPDRFG